MASRPTDAILTWHVYISSGKQQVPAASLSCCKVALCVNVAPDRRVDVPETKASLRGPYTLGLGTKRLRPRFNCLLQLLEDWLRVVTYNKTNCDSAEGSSEVGYRG